MLGFYLTLQVVMDIVRLQERDARSSKSRPKDSGSKEGPLSPLSGVTVVDLSMTRAPAYAALLLGEMGARVIRIDPPGGGRWSPLAAYFDRGKESVALDLENPAGREAFQKLVARADVLIEGLLSPEARRLGVDYDSLAPAHPRLVYCALPPLADEGPLAGRPADERVADAFAGLYGDQGGDGQPPAYVRIPIGAYGGTLLAATGVLAALEARRRTGRGQKVETSLLAGAMALHVSPLVDAGHPGYSVYRTADGWLGVGAADTASWQALLRTVDAGSLVEDPGLANGPAALAPERQAELRARLEQAFAQRPAHEWQRTLDERGVPAAVVRTHPDALRDPQVAASGMIVEVDDPVLGPTIQPGPPVRMGDMPPPATGTAPTPGRDSTRILKELGYGDAAVLRATSRATATLSAPTPSPAPPIRPASGGVPLDGVLAIGLAGGAVTPYVLGLLADLGATVIEVGPSGAGASPVMAPETRDRGTRNVVLDLRQPEALEAVYRMTDHADIIVADGGHGMDYAAAASRNPRLIVCSCATSGPDGPARDHPAVEIVVQARTGAQVEQGGPGNPPSPLRGRPFECGAALQALLAVLTALHARERTGLGRRVETSLVHSALAMQATDFLRYVRDGEPDGAVYQEPYLDPRGPSPDRHLYRASDAWILVSCDTEAQWAALLSVTGAPADLRRNSVEPERVAAALQERFEVGAAAAWEARLLKSGVPCAVSRKSAETLQDRRLQDLGLVAEHGPRRQAGVLWRFSETSGAARRAVLAHGERTEDVLAKFGLSGAEIAAIKARNGETA